MQLKPGTLLQGGKYEIERVIGQGGFGITYLAYQVLYSKRVCIKEFFFKDYCIRTAIGDVTSVTEGNIDIVYKFKNKFLKEAKIISSLNHPNIVRILDVFEENNTAYYVMEYVNGYSLADRVNKYGALNESDAVEYIKQIGNALGYIHQQHINHLDIKPANIMIRRSDNKAILIDFGVSKQYDMQGGQTSTTPVGMSHGYAPMEQYNAGGVSTFSPQTDIYSLGATLYKLVTGNTPPQAGDILNDGLPELPSSISKAVAETIKKSMQVRKIDRYNNIDEFLRGLDGISQQMSFLQFSQQETQAQQSNVGNEETRMFDEMKEKASQSQNAYERPSYMTSMESEKKEGKKKYGCILFFILAWFLIIVYFSLRGNGGDKSNNPNDTNKVTQQSAGTYKQQNAFQKQGLVDLGLSVKWAANNVGASNVWDAGIYYLTNSRLATTYGPSPFQTININGTAAKQLNLKQIEKEENLANLKAQGYIIPTEAHFIELLTKCDWTQIILNGVEGYKVTGKNGNSIFIPITGRVEYAYERMNSRLYHRNGDCCFLVEGKTQNKNTNGHEHVAFINEANESIEFIGLENLKTKDKDYCNYLEEYEKGISSFKPWPEIVGRNIRLVKK